MTKAKSKAQKRRDKRLVLDGMGLSPAPRRERNGQARRTADTEFERSPEKTALEARQRQYGGKTTRKGADAMRGQNMGCQMGMVIQREARSHEVAGLWTVFADWCAAEDRYRRRYLGQSEHAKTANLGMIPERVETDKNAKVDLRTEEERDRAAVGEWMRWQGYLGKLPTRDMATALHDARLDRSMLWRDGDPTPAGMRSLEALRALAKIV